jgi:hypothetical protein
MPEGLPRKHLIVLDLDNEQTFATLTDEMAPAFAIQGPIPSLGPASGKRIVEMSTSF